jgi:hypothetical protein
MVLMMVDCSQPVAESYEVVDVTEGEIKRPQELLDSGFGFCETEGTNSFYMALHIG